MAESRTLLRRYTDLASALDILKRKQITMLPPSAWDDRNDRLMMETYRKSRGLETLLALCLSTRPETYHHWRVMTNGATGVCIQFKRSELIRALQVENMRKRTVKYITLSQLRESPPKANLLPFLKRSAFKDEGEYRFVYESSLKERELKKIPIDLNTIERISLSPWMPAGVADSIIQLIEGLAPKASFEVVHSKLIDNLSWRRFARTHDPDENNLPQHLAA